MKTRKMLYSKFKKIRNAGVVSITDKYLKKYAGKEVIVEIYEIDKY